MLYICKLSNKLDLDQAIRVSHILYINYIIIYTYIYTVFFYLCVCECVCGGGATEHVCVNIVFIFSYFSISKVPLVSVCQKLLSFVLN
jgi:hypothetical protein